MPTGFEKYKLETLLTIHANLLRGLDRVAETIDNGTFHTPPKDSKGGVPPAQAGQTFLFLLKPLVAELKRRGYHPEQNERKKNGL